MTGFLLNGLNMKIDFPRVPEIGVGRLFFFLVIAIFFSMKGAGIADGLRYSGAFELVEDPGGETISSLAHKAGLSLGQEFTNFISVSENVTYTHSVRDELPTNETLAQDVNLVNLNQFCRVNLSGSKRSLFVDGQEQNESDDLELGFMSQWRDTFPTMSATASKTISQQKQQVGEPEVERTELTTAVTWHRTTGDFYYSYKVTERETSSSDLLTTTEVHSAKLDFNDSYWNKKLRVRFSQAYNFNRIEKSTPGFDYTLPVAISEVRTGNDPTPLDSIEETVVNNLMRDGDLATPAYNVVANSTFNTIVVAVNFETVDLLYLYTQTSFVSPPAGLNWSLYTNDFLGTGWNDDSVAISGVVYNAAEQRFEITISPLSVGYIKIGLDYSSLVGPLLDFTEVKAVNSIASASGGGVTFENSSSFTSISLSSILTRNLTLDYLGDYTIIESEGVAVSKRDSLYQFASLGYRSLDQTIYSKIAMHLDSVHGRDSTKYSFQLGKEFLPTLYGSLGWGSSEDSVASQLTRERSYYYIDSTAQLYPDLEMKVGISSTESWDLRNNIKVESQSNGIYLDLTARLWPAVTMTFREAIAQSQKPISFTTFTSRFGLAWSVSSSLFLNLAIDHITNSLLQGDSYAVDSSLNFAINRQTQLTVKYKYSESSNNEIRQNGNALLGWTIKRGLRVDGGVDYSREPNNPSDETLAYGRLTLNFGVP